MDIIHATNESFNKIINMPSAIIDFWAPWCGPCRMLAPILEEINSERSDIIIAKVNVDDYPELASKYSITSIPAILHFKNGQLIAQTLGYMDKTTLLNKLNVK